LLPDVRGVAGSLTMLTRMPGIVGGVADAIVVDQ